MKIQIGQKVMVQLEKPKDDFFTDYYATNGKIGEVVRYLGSEEESAWVKILDDGKSRGYSLSNLLPVLIDDNGEIIKESDGSYAVVDNTYSDAVINWLGTR